MSFATRYLDAQTVEQLNHLQVAARSVVEGTALGLHKTQLKGASVEFRQHRAYVPGDEPRRLDWRILARTDRPFVKEYDEETNLRALLMLDCSGSMAYGSKFDHAARLVAALSYLVLAANESVGVAMLADGSEDWLPPRSGSLQLSRVIHALEQAAPAGQGMIFPSVRRAVGRLGRRALVILISDFFSTLADLRDALARLRHDRHEIICLRVLHPDELSFPFKNWTLFHDLENRKPNLCEPALIRSVYLANFKRHTEQLTTLCRSMSAELHVMMSDQPVAESIKHFVKARARQ